MHLPCVCVQNFLQTLTWLSLFIDVSVTACLANRNEFCLPGNPDPVACPTGYTSPGGPQASIKSCMATLPGYYIISEGGIDISQPCPSGYFTESRGRAYCESCRVAPRMFPTIVPTKCNNTNEIVPWCGTNGRVPKSCVPISSTGCAIDWGGFRYVRVGDACCLRPQQDHEVFVYERTKDPRDGCATEWSKETAHMVTSLQFYIMFRSDNISRYSWDGSQSSLRIKLFGTKMRHLFRTNVYLADKARIFDKEYGHMSHGIRIHLTYGSFDIFDDIWETLFNRGEYEGPPKQNLIRYLRAVLHSLNMPSDIYSIYNPQVVFSTKPSRAGFHTEGEMLFAWIVFIVAMVVFAGVLIGFFTRKKNTEYTMVNTRVY